VYRPITTQPSIVTVRKAIAQGIASGVPSYLLTQALRTARDRGAITVAEHHRLSHDLDSRA
jgi:hypothetical protein